MRAAAAAQEFEQAALERNRLRAVRSLLERQRVANEAIGTLDAVAIALEGTDANAQVFQVRDGVLSDRQSFYLANETERELAEVAEEFMLQYYGGGATSIPAQIVVQREVRGREALAEALALQRGGPVELRAAERGDKRRILELAERNAVLALDQERMKVQRGRQRRAEALDGLQQALGLDVPPVRIECFDISNLGGTHTVASMVVFEGGAPKKSDYRRFTIRTVEGSDDFASMAEVLTRRYAQWERQADISPHDASYDPSFAALPNVIVIDGGKGQLSAGLAAAARVSRPGRGGHLAGQAHRGGLLPRAAGPARARPPDAGAAAAAARARRGAPLRHHAPPHPPRPRHDELAARRPAGRRPGPQAGAAAPLRLARGDPRRQPRGAAGRPGAAREDGARAARPPAPGRMTRPAAARAGDTRHNWAR